MVSVAGWHRLVLDRSRCSWRRTRLTPPRWPRPRSSFSKQSRLENAICASPRLRMSACRRQRAACGASWRSSSRMGLRSTTRGSTCRVCRVHSLCMQHTTQRHTTPHYTTPSTHSITRCLFSSQILAAAAWLRKGPHRRARCHRNRTPESAGRRRRRRGTAQGSSSRSRGAGRSEGSRCCRRRRRRPTPGRTGAGNSRTYSQCTAVQAGSTRTHARTHARTQHKNTLSTIQPPINHSAA